MLQLEIAATLRTRFAATPGRNHFREPRDRCRRRQIKLALGAVRLIYDAQPAGTGPILLSGIEPEAPLLEPPVKLNVNVALEQSWNASVPVPTASLCGVANVESRMPPVVA